VTDCWLPKKALAASLHCSERTIESCCAQAVFIAGEHFYKAGLKRGALVFNLDACRQALLDHTAARQRAERDEPMPVTYDEGHLNQLIAEVRTND
jgi:hypothetical protein